MVVRKAMSGHLFLALSIALLAKRMQMTLEGLWGNMRREIAKKKKNTAKQLITVQLVDSRGTL